MYIPKAHLPLLLLISLHLDVAAATAHCLKNYRFRFLQTLDTFSIRQLSAWSGGGGTVYQINSNDGAATHPFKGREFGSGGRKVIYGTRSYGSGYPYGAANASTVGGRPFPFGAYPVYWANDYLGSAEYASELAEITRPGGRLAVADLHTTKERWNDVDEAAEIYTLIGDRDSVASVMASMVDWCRATPQWPTLFDATSPNATLKPENVLQYYRASSFALAFKDYNNTFAVNPTSTDLGFDQSTVLGQRQMDSLFLKCINETIAHTVPILDMGPKKGWSTGVTVGVILSICLGPFVLFWTCIKVCSIF